MAPVSIRYERRLRALPFVTALQQVCSPRWAAAFAIRDIDGLPYGPDDRAPASNPSLKQSFMHVGPGRTASLAVGQPMRWRRNRRHWHGSCTATIAHLPSLSLSVGATELKCGSGFAPDPNNETTDQGD